MKINSIFHSIQNDKNYKCILHIENQTITKIVSENSNEFKTEFEKIQPSILGTKHFNLWKNENENGFPYSISYNINAGTQFLYLDYSKLKYLIVKQLLKINYNNIITSFIVYSFFVLIGIFLNIINGNFILSQIDILTYIWCIISFIIIWKCMSKIETNKEEIISLKKEIIERKIK